MLEIKKGYKIITTAVEIEKSKTRALEALRVCNAATSFLGWLCVDWKSREFRGIDFAKICISIGPEFKKKFPCYLEYEKIDNFRSQVIDALKVSDGPEEFLEWFITTLKMKRMKERACVESFLFISIQCCERYKDYFSLEKIH